MLDNKTVRGTGTLYRVIVPGMMMFRRRFPTDKEAITYVKGYIPMKKGWTMGVVREVSPSGKVRWLLTRFNSKGNVVDKTPYSIVREEA